MSQSYEDRRSHPSPVTLETLADLREELDELQRIVAPSRTLIALSRLASSVEAYFELRGLAYDRQGRWLARHWSYGLFEQLARHIQNCKDHGGQIDNALINFIDQQLLPQLSEHKSALS